MSNRVSAWKFDTDDTARTAANKLTKAGWLVERKGRIVYFVGVALLGEYAKALAEELSLGKFEIDPKGWK